MKFLLCCPNSYEVLPAFKLGPSPPDSLHLRALEVRMDGRRKALTQDCATAHFSDKQFVLPASMAEYFWEVTSGYFVFKSHIELRIMVFVCSLKFFSIFLMSCFNNFPKFIFASCFICLDFRSIQPTATAPQTLWLMKHDLQQAYVQVSLDFKI